MFRSNSNATRDRPHELISFDRFLSGVGHQSSKSETEKFRHECRCLLFFCILRLLRRLQAASKKCFIQIHQHICHSVGPDSGRVAATRNIHTNHMEICVFGLSSRKTRNKRHRARRTQSNGAHLNSIAEQIQINKNRKYSYNEIDGPECAWCAHD